MIQNKEVLEQIREEAVKELNSYDCRILVCSGTGCVATGSQKIYEKFMEIAKDAPGVTIEFGPHDKDAHVGVKKTGCQGVCELGPLVRIQKGDDVIPAAIPTTKAWNFHVIFRYPANSRSRAFSVKYYFVFAP